MLFIQVVAATPSFSLLLFAGMPRVVCHQLNDDGRSIRITNPAKVLVLCGRFLLYQGIFFLLCLGSLR